MIYFISNGNGEVKIGFTDENQPNGGVEYRLSVLQVGNPRPLKILRVVDGGRKTEQWLHDRYRINGYWIRGDWFVLNAEMLTIVPPDEIPVKRERKPTMTTEEYLREADRFGLLSQRQRKLFAGALEGGDHASAS